MFASAAWSDDSWAALAGAALVAALFATALVQAAGPGITPVLRGLAVGTVTVLVLSLAVAVVDPLAGVNDLNYQRGALRGIFSHRNTLGYTLAIGAPALVALAPRTLGGRIARIVAIVAVVAGTVATQSATALVAVGISAVIALVLFIVRRTPGRRARVLTAGIGLSVLVVAGAAWTAVSELLGRSSDLTGRTYIWRAAWQVASERPVVGFGWNSVWNYAQDPGLRIQRKLGYHFSHPHDAWLEVMLSLGLVGLAVVVWLLAATAWRAAHAARGTSRAAYWFPLVVAVTLVYTVPETMLTRPLGLWLLALVLLLAVRDRVETDAEAVTPER